MNKARQIEVLTQEVESLRQTAKLFEEKYTLNPNEAGVTSEDIATDLYATIKRINDVLYYMEEENN